MNDSLGASTMIRSADDHDNEAQEPIALCEVLDRVLNKGVVVAGEVIISVADIDLIYLNLQVLLASVETACRGRWSSEDARYGGVA